MRLFLVLLVFAPALAGCLDAGPSEIGAGGFAAPRLTCLAPCIVEVDESPGRAWEPSVAVDPTDPRHILAASMEYPAAGDARRAVLNRIWLKIHISVDGGATWESRAAGGGADSDRDHENFMDNVLADPVVAFLADGTAVLAFQASTAPGVAVGVVEDARTIYLARSPDGGRTWPEIVRVADGVGPNSRGLQLIGGFRPDNAWLAQGRDGTLLLAWLSISNDPNDPTGVQGAIRFSASDDGGRTWTEQAPVDDRAGHVFVVAFPLIDAAGDWHVSYWDEVTGVLLVATSRDHGSSWEPREISDRASPAFLKAGPHADGERLWLVYQAEGEEDGTQVPVVRWSDDGGSTWSTPAAIDEEQPYTSVPALDIAEDGTAIIAWFHNFASTTELRFVAIRGDTLGGSFTAAGGIPGNGANVGDYFGLAALADGAIAVYTARGESSRDVFAARVTLRP
ncbi:MAG TPA: sialidase family protein [Candidatus Thermoplasmatota archaeon]|nr:sialidase family protein [Candidatus Thermoplasmatota archaeon]